ncbi:hypothetical protein FGADI_7131 [Fusarium gaditjirri]|uniref:Sulfatase N-terminal domain-containing protein n=1 Tax=Fusarium gaditjirri TaxID=282569 RepID=A0A8H4T637_9HYPO|nr:hypothetical protein FGADI_7131 [Fusarium gaditjirri]
MGSIPTRKQPNFLIIVADDLGYSDLECFGSDIATPNLDHLSSMLISGADNHIADLGQMTEHMARFMDKYKNRPGYEGYLNFRVAALSEILQDAGYHAIMSGKWHLGTTNETSPHARGFDNSYVFLSGCYNHYNYEPQLDDPAHGFFTPMNAGKFWMQDDRFLDRKKPEDIPDDFHSTTTFSEKLANLVELGLISEDTEPAPMTVELWYKMSPTEKAESATKMEVYAAMVDLIDVNIGRVVDYLDSVDELDNTFALFMSDNGAEGAMLEAVPIMGSAGSVPRIINRYYNNSIDNMGMADSYI